MISYLGFFKIHFLKMPTVKVIKFRIILTILLLSIVWLTYQFMNSVVPPIALQKELPSQTIVELNPEKILTYGQKLTVTVFYECLCPDSRSFFVNHLLPSFEKAPNLFNFDLVPYGKASTSVSSKGGYEFSCQHGALECQGNTVHACMIAKVHDDSIKLKLITCMIDDNFNPIEVGKKCSAKFGVDWKPIEDCANGMEGNLFLKQHGDKTLALNPKVSFIPTILMNKNREGQPAILKNLWKEICNYYPRESVAACQ